MVTYFNTKDIVSFGEYLLSNERKEMIKKLPDSKETNLESRLKSVSHADIENWKVWKKKRLNG
jgi:hypothetical protein